MDTFRRSSPTLASERRLGGDRLSRWGFAALVVIYVGFTVPFAVDEPRGPRFWDERFNFDVVERLLAGSAAEPINHWYAPLSWAPQLAVLKLTDRLATVTGSEALAVRGPGGRRLTHFGVVLCRLVNVGYAVIALLLLYRLAMRLVSPRAAAWSALVFVSSPWAVRCAVEFKPDPLLLATTLLCLLWALPLMRTDAWGSFARSGFALGLTVSAKLNGVLAAPSVALAVLAGGFGRRRLTRAAAALGLAAATFLATQPWLFDAIRYWKLNRAHYAYRAAPISFAEMALHPWRELLAPRYLGALLGGIALASLVLLAVRSLRDWRTSDTARARAVVFSYPLAYTLGVAAAVRYPKDNLWIQLLPFAALAAGWGIAGALERLGSLVARLPRSAVGSARAARLARSLLGATVVGFGLAQSASYVRARIAVPTGEVLQRQAGRMLSPGHLVAAVGPARQRLPRFPRRISRGPDGGRDAPVERIVVVRLPRMAVAADGSAPELALFDATLFAPERLDRKTRADLRRHLRDVPERAITRVAPRWPLRPGPEWILVAHPWSVRGEPHCRPLVGAGAVELPRPEQETAAVAATVSLRLVASDDSTKVRMRLGERKLPMYRVVGGRAKAVVERTWSSRRFRWRDEPLLVVPPVPGFPAGAVACVQLWSPPERLAR